MRRLLIFSFMLLTAVANAQYFQTGQDPSSLKWRQINTENFQLIYPDNFEEQAQVLAQKLELVYDYGTFTLKHKPSKISIILHTQTVKSNGLVAIAPKRSEFYTTPHQNIYQQDWLEQLAIHEFRHVVQIDKLNKEMPGIINLLLGEQGTALIFGGYLPWWFIEGDAVTTETALSKSGRGRFASFLMENRAQVVEKGVYSYDKAYLGSYKSYVPNHYRLGYYLVSGARERYGADIWERTITNVGQKPFSLNPFNKALKNEIGMNKVELYHSIFDSLAVEWKNEDLAYQSAPAKIISPAQKIFTNYKYNHWLNDSEIISYRTGMEKIPAFVKFDKAGNEKVLHLPGTIFDESVNHRGEWIVWSEQVPSLRWAHSGYSVIKMLNTVNGEKLKFKPEYKALAPSISSDLREAVVVESDFSSNHYLSVYQTEDGKLLHRIQTTNNNYFLSPDWLNSEELVAIMLTGEGKRLVKINKTSGEIETLIQKDLGNLKQLKCYNNSIYFISSYSGKNSLYSFSLSNGEIVQLYEPRFGVDYPAINSKDEILLSDYTADGYRIMELQQASSVPVNRVEPATYSMAENVAAQEKGIVEFEKADTVLFKSKSYKKGAHLFNVHSWAPLFVDPYNYEFQTGVSLASQNKLGTTETVLGYKWDTSERIGQFYGRFIYKGWYPVFDVEYSVGKRASNYFQIIENTSNGQVVSRDTSVVRYTWKENVISASAYLPLYLSSGKFYRMLRPEISYELTDYKNDSSTPEEFPDESFHSLAYRLYFYQLLKQSSRDVYPDFGIILDASYKHSPFGSQNIGSLQAGESMVYLPGILPNHGIRFYGGLQNRSDGDIFSFSDVVNFPRGWGSYSTEKLYSTRFDYKLPLFNPDVSFGGLAYIKRINLSLFYDYARLKGENTTSDQSVEKFDFDISSYGVEVLSNLHFFRFYSPVNIGMRASYLSEIDELQFDLLLSIDFTSL